MQASGDPLNGGGRIDLKTGEVWPQPAIEYARDSGEEDEDSAADPELSLWVHCEGSRLVVPAEAPGIGSAGSGSEAERRV